MNAITSLATISQKPFTGSDLICPRNHLTCFVLSPGGAYVLIKSTNGGEMKTSLKINGIANISKYASHGDAGGILGIENASAMCALKRGPAINLSTNYA